MERRTPSTSVELGSIGDAVRANVRRVRQSLGKTLKQLADDLATNGYPLAQSALSKIENGTRRVDVDDLVALSVVLGVSPLALLVPYDPNPRALVTIPGWGDEPAMDAWMWATGTRGLDGEPGGHGRNGLPWWLQVQGRYVLDGIHPDSEEHEIRLRVEAGHDGER